MAVHLFEALVHFIIGDRGHRRFGLADEGDRNVHRRSNAVADQQDRGAGLEPAHRLGHVAHGEDADAVQAKPLERILQRLRNPFDDHDDRSGPRGGGATHLIFEQGAASEWKQGTKAFAVVLLIGADERADGHFRRYPPPLRPTA